MSFMDNLKLAFQALSAIVLVVGGIYVSLILLVVVVGAVGSIAQTSLTFLPATINASITTTVASFSTMVTTITGNIVSLLGFIMLAVILVFFAPMIRNKGGSSGTPM